MFYWWHRNASAYPKSAGTFEMREVENVILQFAARMQEAKCQSSPVHNRQIYEILNSMLREHIQAQANTIYEQANSWGYSSREATANEWPSAQENY